MEKVFISYSWDSEEHKLWVLSLVNELREYGVNAVVDDILQENNLNTMMVENIKNSDKIIVVITPNYTQKADNLHGGVGYETKLLHNYILNDPNKIIPVLRMKATLPFYLEGYRYIDCSNARQSVVEELVNAIRGTAVYSINPVNTINPKKVEQKKVPSFFEMDDDHIIPNFKRITTDDVSAFIDKKFADAINRVSQLLKKTKETNANFDFKVTTRMEQNNRNSYFNSHEEKNIKVASFEIALDSNITKQYEFWCGEGMIGMNGIFGYQLERYSGKNQFNAYNFWVSFRINNKEIEMTGSMNSLMNHDKLRNTEDLAKLMFKELMSGLK